MHNLFKQAGAEGDLDERHWGRYGECNKSTSTDSKAVLGGGGWVSGRLGFVFQFLFLGLGWGFFCLFISVKLAQGFLLFASLFSFYTSY